MSIRFVSDKPKSMKKLCFYVFCFLLLTGCVHRNPLSEMRFQTVMAPPYVIATWYKITAPGEPVKFYIEGWGVENMPNPDSELMRDLAKGDDSPNVVYVALPCQYGVHVGCVAGEKVPIDETLVNSMKMVVQTMMKKAKATHLILVGYDAGAEVATDLALIYRPYVRHLITLGGMWEQEPERDILRVAQTHYRGKRDEIAPIQSTPVVFPKESIVEVSWGSHTGGYWTVRKYIWNIH